MQHKRLEQSIFNTVPKHDYLGITTEPEDFPKKVVDFLNFSNSDVANATGIAKNSIRYDGRIPEELRQRLLEIGTICELVADYFKGDLKKTALWFQLKNPAFGNLSPREMILIGRYQKLNQFIQNALNGDQP